MGEIIRLRPRQGARSAAEQPQRAQIPGPAGDNVVLFLGVRYERHDEGGSTPTRPDKRGGSRRKRA